MTRFAAALLRGFVAMFTGLLVAGGTLTLAADRAGVDRPMLLTSPGGPQTMTVPQVTGQVYVFAKGILEDDGFAWSVVGPVHGYAANTVVAQRPAPGTIVLDTGAPTIALTLARSAAYPQTGSPQDGAPYAGTALRLPGNLSPAAALRTAPWLRHSAPPAAAPRFVHPMTHPAAGKTAPKAPKGHA